MVVKKVPARKGAKGKAGRVIGLADYITNPELENGLEKCICNGGENFITDTHEGQKNEMIALSMECTRSKDPIDHFVLSFKSNERPTAEQADQAVKMFLDHLGLTGHQVIWGMHDDTQNMHIHIAVNRVNPDTLRAVEVNKGFDLEAAHQAIAKIEAAQGWSKEKKARYQTDASGELVLDAKGRPAKRKTDADKKLEPTTKALDMEVQTGEKSAQRIGIEKAAPIIKSATSWKELHEQLAAHGMRYERKGSGAIIFIGDVPVKASDVDRKAGLSALEKRLGAYQPLGIIPTEGEDHDEQNDNPTGITGSEPNDREAAEELDQYRIRATELGIRYRGHPVLQKSNARSSPAEASTARESILRDMSEFSVAQDGIGHEVLLQADALPDMDDLEAISDIAMRRAVSRDEGSGRSRPVNSNNHKHLVEPMRSGQPGWAEYQTIKNELRATKAAATAEVSNQQSTERAELFAKQKAERAEMFKGDWKGKGALRNEMQSILATQHAAAKLELSEQHRADRQELQAQYKPLPQYKQWQAQPQIVAEQVRPIIDQHLTRDQQPPRLSEIIKSLSYTTDQRHHLTYRLAGKDIFRDEGRTLQVLDQSSTSLAATLAIAQQKYGQTLTLTGSDDFKRHAVAVAVENNLTCKFADPELDALRVRLVNERQAAERLAEATLRTLQSAERANLAETQQKVVVAKEAVAVSETNEVIEKITVIEAENAAIALAAPADLLADIERLTAAYQQDHIKHSSKSIMLADTTSNKLLSGAIICSNDDYVTAIQDNKLLIHKKELFMNLEYDGKAEGHDRFSPGSTLEVQYHRNDGKVKAKIFDKRIEFKSPDRRDKHEHSGLS